MKTNIPMKHSIKLLCAACVAVTASVLVGCADDPPATTTTTTSTTTTGATVVPAPVGTVQRTTTTY